MLLPKINFKFLLPIFIIFSNFWIYKIFSQNILTGMILVVTSLAILLKPKSKIVVIGLLLLFFMQIQGTSIKSLVLLDNDEQRVQSERSKSYPLTYIDLGFKVVWLKPETWIEKNNLVIVLSKLEENLFYSLDINRYFFGGFPRNKPEDFEKFPLAYLPLFVIGIYILVKKKSLKKLAFLLGVPLLLLTYLGSDNKLGPVILFPFFILSIFEGTAVFETLFMNKRLFYLVTVSFVILTFILQISYGQN